MTKANKQHLEEMLSFFEREADADKEKAKDCLLLVVMIVIAFIGFCVGCIF